MMNPKEIYQLMFNALEKHCRTNPSEELRNFCSDANPFLFTDGTSADPAVSDDFCKFFQKKTSARELDIRESLAFVKEFLESIQDFTYSYPKIKAAIESFSEKEWIEAAEKMRLLPIEMNPFE